MGGKNSPVLAGSFFKFLIRGRREQMGRGGYDLEFSQWLRMATTEKRNLICFICYIYKGYFST